MRHKRIFPIALLFSIAAMATPIATISCADEARDPIVVDDDDPVDDDPVDDDDPVEWTIEEADAVSGGYQLQLAISASDEVVIAHWANDSYADGICDEVATGAPTRLRQDLRFVWHDDSLDAWQSEVVASPPVLGPATGLSLRFDSQNQAALAYTGGEAHPLVCMANDAVFATGGASNWAYQTAAAESGDAVTGEPASDFGYVVGYWPALAFDNSDNPAIVYKDVHSGTMQHDDRYRADLEMALRQGSTWQHEAIDFGEGAGDYATLLFDDENRPVVAYAITIEAQEESRLGVWVKRQESDGTWSEVIVHHGEIHQEVRVLQHPVSGDLLVAFYSTQDQAVRLRTLTNPANFEDASAWSSEIVGDARYDEGQGVSIAFLPSGELAMAYHRCKRITSTTSGGCDQNDEATIFAYASGSSWIREEVDSASSGSCGDFVGLGIDSQSRAWVAYRCTTLEDSTFVQRLFVANKQITP
ncbi:hypothetical protein KAI87_11635 [Myxococcota bacterium]|nr:hypothetical protein [Myxococcota bacterium]